MKFEPTKRKQDINHWLEWNDAERKLLKIEYERYAKHPSP